MKKQLFIVGLCVLLAGFLWSCKDDVTSAGESVLDDDDAIIVLVDTFPITSGIDSCKAIISQADSCLLGEMETDYGLLRASVMTQLACPEGFSYPEGATVDSICLFMYYSSWEGSGLSPMAISAYMMDKKTFNYNSTYPTDLQLSDYCTMDENGHPAFPILVNHRIVAASEKMDSVVDSYGNVMPMVRMRLNDNFKDYFWAIQSFESQEAFNKQFKGLVIESSFGSSTILNVSNLSMGVYYSFKYNKAGKDTTIHTMKSFYANAEVRMVNRLEYRDKREWIEELKKDSDTYNYIIAPAGVYTRMVFPMARITDSIMAHMITIDGEDIKFKRPYVNKAAVRVAVENVYSGSASQKTRNDWLQPADHMLLIKEESMERFFAKKELPSDTCALLSALTQSVDSSGNAIYYYTYDLSDFLTNQLRQLNTDDELRMMLVPVSVNTTNTAGSATGGITAVRQQETLSATKIRSAKNGMELELVYCGFAIPNFLDE